MRSDETPRRPIATLAMALACAAVGAWVYWPAIHVGFYSDDFLHLAMLRGHEALAGLGRWDLFDLVSPTPDRLGPVQGDFGVWWGRGVRAHFLRPLTALTYHADHRLFGADATAFQAMTLAWYAALVAASVALYSVLARQSGRGPSTVLVAGIFFAFTMEHCANVGWLAGRYSLVSITFCVLSLLAYHRHRVTRRRGALAASLCLLVLGLLGGEVAVSFTAFFLAYELALVDGPWRERARALAPVVLVHLAWFAFYVAADFGTENSLGYIDPLREPMEFWTAGVGRLTENLSRALLPGAFEDEFAPSFFPSVLALYEHPSRFSSHVLVVLLVASCAQAAFDRGMRFALIGMLLSLIPMSAAPSQARVLLVATIAVGWIHARLVMGAIEAFIRARGLRRSWSIPRLLLALVLVASLVGEFRVVRYRLETRTLRAQESLEQALALPMPDEVDPSEMRVLLLTVPSVLDISFIPMIRLVYGHPWPAGIWTVSPVQADHWIERTGEKSLRIRVEGVGAAAGLLPRDFVPPGVTLDSGTEFRIGVLEVTLGRVHDAEIVESIDVTIDRSFGDAGVLLFAWSAGAWVRVGAPPIGQSSFLPR